jgi:uncharacterized membrane protein YphA (DoxX/SURF4 family)
MNVVLWITAGILAMAFLAGGVLKVVTPKEKLAAMANQGWAEDFGPGSIKAIGSLEILAAIGLTLPAMLDIAPIFVPLAAVGLALLMAGAFVTHLRRKESQGMALTLILLVVCVLVAIARFGPESFTS